MKCIILAGGRGTRLIPLTNDRPKPLIEIGGIPILYHIIERFRRQGISDFVVAGGYKWEMIRNYVAQNPLSGANIRVEDTGLDTLTGGRLKMVVPENEEVIVTYGDDISNIDIREVVKTHRQHQRPGITIVTTRVKSNWGHIEFNKFLGYEVIGFREKPLLESWINAGNWVIDSEICKDIRETETMEQWLERMVHKYEVTAYRYEGLFCGMNTYADYIHLNDLWEQSQDWTKISS
jgi:glucose-1-phosphate cytidylyltransferase